jgi:DNA-binding NtrC family response regulator
MEESPILIIDDDQDDLEMIKEAAVKINITRPIHFFQSSHELTEFLRNSDSSPFLIISDVNLPSETGFDIRKSIYDDAELKYKSVPFIFWSTAASEKQIQFAYDLPAQGFFFKPSNFDDLCEIFKTIVNYWQKSQHPKRIK